LNELLEIKLEDDHSQFWYGQGEMFVFAENFKEAPMGKFNLAELQDLEMFNNKQTTVIEFLAEDGTVIPREQVTWGLGSSYVGLHNKSKHKIKNAFKITPLKIDRVLFDTKEQVTAKYPASSIKPGEVVEIEVDWKPSANRRKGLSCATMILADPQWSKRMEWALYKDQEYEN